MQDVHGPRGVAVVGAGYWGPNIFRNMQASSHFAVRWVVDLDMDRAARLVGDSATAMPTKDLEEALDDDQVQCVAVATPAATHHEIVMSAIRAGKHVLVEKPLAATYAEGREMVLAAEAAGVVLMIDHTYCYTPAVQKIRELVHSGGLGDVQFVDSVRINLGLVQRDVDVLWDLSPHDLSILDFVLPPSMEPLAVAAHGADPIGAGRACVAYLTLTLPGDAIAHVHVNWLSPTKVRTTMIGGSRRTLVWDDLNPSQRISIFDRGVDLTPVEALGIDDRRAATVSYRSGDMLAPALPEKEALRSMVDEFESAITEGRPPVTDGRAGLRVLDILEAASRSLQFHGATVPLRSAR